MRATFAATVSYIVALGFIPVSETCFLSPGEDATGDFNVDVYLSAAGHYCVSIDGGYRAPIVWDDERLPEFVEWLHQHHAGWSGSTWARDIPADAACLSDVIG